MLPQKFHYREKIERRQNMTSAAVKILSNDLEAMKGTMPPSES